MAPFRASISVERTVTGSLEPIDIHGNWVVNDVRLQPGTTTMGITKDTSKFKIRNQGHGHVLQKTAKVDWNGNGTVTIKLGVVRAQRFRNANFVLGADVKLDGARYRLLLGSDDSGSTLKIQLDPASTAPIAGGSGAAGRGV